MSTKTNVKRIAAVAAAALTLAGFSAVSAHAAPSADVAKPFYISVADSGSQTSASATTTTATATAIAGAMNYVELTVPASTTALASATSITVATSGAGSNIQAKTDGTAGAWVLNNASSAAGTLATAMTSAAHVDISGTTVQINTPTAGTVTITVAKNVLANGSYTTTTLQTFTVTVTAASVVGQLSVGNSTSYISDSSTVYANIGAIEGASLAADSTVLATKGTAGVPAKAAAIQVTLKDTQTSPVTMTSKKLTATITGSGLIDGTGSTADHALLDSPARVAVSTTGSSNGIAGFVVYSDGTAGVGTVTISYTDAALVTTVVATETVTFYGGVAAITPTVVTKYVASSGSAWPTGSISHLNYAVKLKFTDSAGNLVKAAQTITATPADTTKISAATCSQDSSATYAGYYYCSVTGVSAASGASSVKFSVGSVAGGDYVSATADFVVSSAKAATLTFSADASVAAGQVVTYTITAKDANGNPIPDGSAVCDYVGSPVVSGGALVDNGGNGNNVKNLFGCDLTTYTADTAVKFDGGVATDTVQAPFGTAALNAKFTNKTATASSTVLAVALSALVTDVATAVTGDTAAQAAIDAAQEATDAANAAYDAANNAMDSADAATAAAQDAADNASAALAAVTSLSATVAKLVKSVAAIAAALAKVQKKIGA